METLQISKENALKAYEVASDKTKQVLSNLFGEKVFVKNIMERIKTVQDALDYNGETLEQFNKRTQFDDDQEKATKELGVIAKALREGKPLGERSYYPWFNSARSASGFSFRAYGHAGDGSVVGSRLRVDTSEKSTYMGKQFIAIYNRHING